MLIYLSELKNYYNKSHYFLSLTSEKQKGVLSLYSDKTCASDKYSGFN